MNSEAEYTVGDFFLDVDRAFGFLVSDFGFKRVSAEVGWRRRRATAPDPATVSLFDAGPIVRFIAGETVVSVAHDPRAEVQVLIRRPDRPRGSVDPEGLARIAGVPDPGAYSGIYSSANTNASEVLHRLALAVRELGGDWLTHD